MGQRVNLSTAVKRYRKPFEGGIVTRSKWTCSKRLSGTVNSPMGGTVCRVTLACWQGRHSRAHLETSSFIFGQTTLALTDWRVRSTPGCPNPWIALKMGFLKA